MSKILSKMFFLLKNILILIKNNLIPLYTMCNIHTYIHTNLYAFISHYQITKIVIL